MGDPPRKLPQKGTGTGRPCVVHWPVPHAGETLHPKAILDFTSHIPTLN